MYMIYNLSTGSHHSCFVPRNKTQSTPLFAHVLNNYPSLTNKKVEFRIILN